ncbi:MAG: hypothetical protein JST85_12870 [Acidobacteria bacterium]|nr:hypothetical protein [Acidobacteriota bacterium]
MKFVVVQDFTSLAELLRFYSDADEIVFNSHNGLSDPKLDEAEVAEACHDGRWLANRLRLRRGPRPVEEIAASYGCRIGREAWQVADDKLMYLGECLLHSTEGGAVIRINTTATKLLAETLAQWADEVERHWFSEEKIGEVVIAHELFHLIEQRGHSTSVELAAHAFARALTELPFSPLLYNALLLRLATGKGRLTR